MSVDENLIIRRTDPASPDCAELIEELDRLQGSLYPPENNYLDSIDELKKPNCHFLGAYLEQKIVGCAALKIVDTSYAELKRMYVMPVHRNLGIGQRLLDRLEAHAAEAGVIFVRLETGVSQPEALGLYRRNGYQECAAFGGYSDSALSVFLEKEISNG